MMGGGDRGSGKNCALALLFALPTALSFRSSPQAVFWPEFLLVVVLLAVFIGQQLRETVHRLPIAPLLPLAMSSLWVLVTWGHSANALVVGFLAYLLVFLVAADFGAGRGSGFVAKAVLAVALCQSIIGALQLFDVSLGGAVLAKAYRQTYGNVGQPNHYAALLALGLAAVVVGAENWKWPRWLTGAVVVWLSISIAASASRAPWFYMLGFVLLGLVAGRGTDPAGRVAGRRAVAVGIAALLIQIAFAYSGALDLLGVTSSIARAADAGSNGQRLYDWSLALSAIRAHPWMGVGVGGFHGWAVAQMAVTPSLPFSKFAEHAHNLPLHLAATMGLPFAVGLLGSVGWWGLRQLRQPVTSERLFALCGLVVVGLHSFVEYPLWYTYFVIPAGMLCGVLLRSDSQARFLLVPNWVTRAVLLGLAACLFWVARDYVAVQRAYDEWASIRSAATAADRDRVRRAVENVPAWSIFGDHARALALQTWAPDTLTAVKAASECEYAFKLRPSWGLGTQCLLAMATAGDRPGVARMSLILCEGFPRHHQMLRDWAEFADRAHPVTSVRSENCLRG